MQRYASTARTVASAVKGAHATCESLTLRSEVCQAYRRGKYPPPPVEHYARTCSPGAKSIRRIRRTCHRFPLFNMTEIARVASGRTGYHAPMETTCLCALPRVCDGIVRHSARLCGCEVSRMANLSRANRCQSVIRALRSLAQRPKNRASVPRANVASCAVGRAAPLIREKTFQSSCMARAPSGSSVSFRSHRARTVSSYP